MFIFAHVFCGTLIGLAFWYVTRDRRALPVCIMGAVLPDVLDKPLALVFPEILGSGRTIGHSLVFVIFLFAAGIVLWRWRHTLLGIMLACAVFSHQVLDEMWGDLTAWSWPFAGPFPFYAFPENIWYFIWLQFTSKSEWVFATASLVLIGLWYLALPEHRMFFINTRTREYARACAALLLGIMGIYLLFAGLSALPDAFFAPGYDTVTETMAGILALGGSVVVVRMGGFHSRIRGFT